MPIDLYFSYISPPSRTVYMVTKELGIDVNIKFIDVPKEENKTPEYLKMNPQHTIPTINDDGFILWDSHAISAYLFGKYSDGKKDFLYPKDLKKRALVDRLLHFEGGMLFPPFLEYILPRVGMTSGDPAIGESKLHNALGFLEAFLDNKGPYFTGDHYTLADISIFSTVVSILAFDVDNTNYPKLKAWSARMQAALPYFKECNGPALKFAKQVQQK